MKLRGLNSDRGFATLIALIMVAMLTIIGLAAMSTSDDELSIASNEWQEKRAFYAAESGLEIACSQIQSVFDSTGKPPAIMPSATIVANTCQVTYDASDLGPAVQEPLTKGTLAGLHALVKSYAVTSVGASEVDNAKVQLSFNFDLALVPIFQFAVFYNNDLEIAPGADMSLIGRVHTNGNMWLQAANSLSMDSYVTAAGSIYHGRKGPGSVDNGDVRVKDADGNYVSMREGSGWLESSDGHWYDSSVARWQGRVQDQAHGQGVLKVPLNGADDDPHVLIEPDDGGVNPDSYENRSTLKFIDRQAYQYIGGVWINVTASMVATGVISFVDDKFVDQRQNDATVDVMELDMQALYDNGYAPDNGVIYYSDETGGTSYPALRLNNASELGAPLTIASANPVYTLGDYNSVNKQPAAILADAVTFLSNNWDDSKSGLYYTNRSATPTTVNASFLTGNVETTSSSYSGGFENLPRFLENWSGVNFYWKGSMVNLWESEQANKPWNRPGVTYYNPPNRVWSYDTDLDDPNKLPPETPVIRVFQKNGWKEEYVGDYRPIAAD